MSVERFELPTNDSEDRHSIRWVTRPCVSKYPLIPKDSYRLWKRFSLRISLYVLEDTSSISFYILNYTPNTPVAFFDNILSFLSLLLTSVSGLLHVPFRNDVGIVLPRRVFGGLYSIFAILVGLLFRWTHRYTGLVRRNILIVIWRFLSFLVG